MNRSNADPCHAKRLTAPGRSAVASVAVSGSAGLETVAPFVVLPGKRVLGDTPLRRIVFGHWRSPGPHSEVGEGVVIARMAADRVEVHCHGGMAAVNRILTDLENAGCRIDEPSQTPDTALESSWKIQVEAQRALTDATTEKQAMILLDQFSGAFQRKIDDVSLRVSSQHTDSALAGVEELLSTWPLGQHLTKPWQVVLGGLPNVGKSSLINALLGFQRTIVFDQPGTTRDVVSTQTVINGWPIELSDTAGIRQIECDIEQQGVQRGRQQLLGADCAVLVLDATCHLSEEQVKTIDLLTRDLAEKPIVVLNKIDLLVDVSVSATHVFSGANPTIGTSAKTGTGINELLDKICQHLVPHSPADGSAVVFTHRQRDMLESTLTALRKKKLERAAQLLSELT